MELEELDDDAATIFCRLRGGDDALPASPSLVRFLDDMVLEKSGFGVGVDESPRILQNKHET
jgi:hypothetical protein